PDLGMVPSPTIATVFAGANPKVPLSTFTFLDHHDAFAYQWRTTLAPGQSVAGRHLAGPTDPGDVAGAHGPGRTPPPPPPPPHALGGLRADDLALVITFAAPGAPAAQLQGTSLVGFVPSVDGQAVRDGLANNKTDR